MKTDHAFRKDRQKNNSPDQISASRQTTSPFRLYRHYLSMIVRCKMQYKKSFFLYSLGMFLTSFCMFLSIFFMFQRFPHVKGYTYNEVLLCYSVVLLGFTMAEIFARGFDSFPGLVRRGEFDRVLLRPRSTILQVLGSQFELGRFSRVAQALVIFVYAITTCGIHFTPLKITALVLMLTGGCLLFSGIFLLQAALCFFVLDGIEFINILTYGLNEHGKYPLDIYGKKVLWILTYIIPFALVQYYPLMYLLDRKTQAWYAFLPLCAVPFMLPCYLFWRFGVKHYKSSGS